LLQRQPDPFTPGGERGAIFSSDRRYRYALWRTWDPGQPPALFIGLNPSTADAETDDPTIRRIKDFAAQWGQGGVYVVNLFAYITPYRKELLTCSDPKGDNERWLTHYAAQCSRVVFAWGSFAEAVPVAASVIAQFPQGEALALNKSGSPRHPLYVKKGTLPRRFRG